MLHKAWNSKEEMPYCFPRSSIKFQGHTGQNITDFDPNWAFRTTGRSQLSNPSDLPCSQLITHFPKRIPDSKVHGASMGSIWGRQVQGGPYVSPMNFALFMDIGTCTCTTDEEHKHHYSNRNSRIKNECQWHDSPSSIPLLSMYLLIHAGINVNSC